MRNCLRPLKEARTKCSDLIKTPKAWATQTENRVRNKQVQLSEGEEGKINKYVVHLPGDRPAFYKERRRA